MTCSYGINSILLNYMTMTGFLCLIMLLFLRMDCKLLKYSNPHSCPVSVFHWPNLSFPLCKDHDQAFTLTPCFRSYKLGRPRGAMFIRDTSVSQGIVKEVLVNPEKAIIFLQQCCNFLLRIISRCLLDIKQNVKI